MATSDLDVVVRRSSRKRSVQWRETMKLSIRATRSKGTSETIPVESRGGQPSHKKKPANDSGNSSDARTGTCGRLPFCGNCGFKHADAEVNFCCKCGRQRESQDSTATALETPVSTEDTSTPDDTAVVDAPESTAGRPMLKLTKLRCGWEITEEHFIAPDGKKFTDRKKASKYYNAEVAKLEPEHE